MQTKFSGLLMIPKIAERPRNKKFEERRNCFQERNRGSIRELVFTPELELEQRSHHSDAAQRRGQTRQVTVASLEVNQRFCFVTKKAPIGNFTNRYTAMSLMWRDFVSDARLNRTKGVLEQSRGG